MKKFLLSLPMEKLEFIAKDFSIGYENERGDNNARQMIIVNYLVDYFKQYNIRKVDVQSRYFHLFTA